MLVSSTRRHASQLLACLQTRAQSWLHTEAEPGHTLQGFRPGAIPSRLVEFQIDIDHAKQAFRRWHAQQWLAPAKLLEQQGTSVRPVLLPFWLFETTVRVLSSATLGFAAEGKQDGSMIWRESEQRSQHREYPWTLGSMQIYGSYKYRRDFIEAVKCPGSLSRTRPLKEAEAVIQSAMAGRGQDRLVDVDAPTMKQSVAWELALRVIHIREIAAAEEALKADTNADVVRDVRVRLQPLRRRARLVYFPAYIVQYTFGEVLAETGERRPQHFMTVISGMESDSGKPQVRGERHFNVRKAQLLTGAAVGSSTLATGAVAAYAFGDPSATLFGVDHIFWVLMSCTTAGLAAQMAPHLLQQNVEAARARADEADLQRIMRMGLGPLDTGDDEALWVTANREWRRWEEADLWRWDPDKRRIWAERLVLHMRQRALRRRRFIAEQATQRERQKAEEEREARRTAQFGESAHARQQRASDPTFGGRVTAGRRDFLGYYELLGLNTEDSQEVRAVTAADIKRAFRKAALKWHPDRRDGLAQQDRSIAHRRFQELSRAYEVLRDPMLRKEYDEGNRIVL